MKKYICLFLIFILLIPSVAADGMTFNGDWQLFNLQPENEQAGSIFYENGYENMLLSVSLDWNTAGNRSVWIFPVPAAPEDISVDMLEGYPYLHGEYLDHEYSGTIGTVIGTAAAYALFPLSGPSVLGIYQSHSGGALQSADTQPDLSVYQHVEKMGLTSELVTAQNADALERYLSGKGMTLPAGSNEILNEYSGKKYSFVVTSVSNVTEFRSQFEKFQFRNEFGEMAGMLSVFVRFPTERAYFPLKLTSAYGSRIIPVTITVNGLVTPVVPENIRAGEPISTYPVYIRSGTVTTYFTQSADRTEYIYPELRQFSNGRESIPATYTKVQIHSPSNNFTDDLWFENNPPVDVIIKDLIIRNKVLLGILIYLILSMLASLIAGLIVFRAGPVSKIRLMIHGLWNCTTMIGFVYATSRRFSLPEDQARNKKLFIIVFLGVFLLLLYIWEFMMIVLIDQEFTLQTISYYVLYLPVLCQYILSVTFALLTHIYLFDGNSIYLSGKYAFIPTLVQILFFVTLIAFIWGMDRSLNVERKRGLLVLYPIYLLMLAGTMYLITLSSDRWAEVVIPVIGMLALIPSGIFFGFSHFTEDPLLASVAIFLNIAFYVGAGYLILQFIKGK